jgi:cobalt/nickel transport protein
MKTIAKLWIGLAILVVLSPVGLLLPRVFKAKGAWGEWGVDAINKLVGYIPQGLEKLSFLWSPPIPAYTLKGWEEKGLPHLGFAYIISALAGVTVVVLVAWLIGKILSNNDD